ncbi:MAG: hypothetical protein LBD59_01440 [Prevotellaceae bacterium]|jgi:uncharacterized protein YjcR|nr:hypothetical protein [Prevotellaceae bacterium]
MAKFNEIERQQKIDYAKALYCKGFDFETIGKFINISIATIRKWAAENDFEKARKSRLIALSEIRATILEGWSDMLDGKKPKITADAAAKLATAFEKLSVNRKSLTYIYEAYEQLTDEYMRNIQNTTKTPEKQALLKHLQTARKFMDNVIVKLNKEILDND